ncbi:hypothetical protein V1512DRAFT_242100 [Lipomyces arxii]|uniref:uncharacterized protein n=1 Tax=Lipomyces arxii TaxID=56418 RepID=UPI0034CF3B37
MSFMLPIKRFGQRTVVLVLITALIAIIVVITATKGISTKSYTTATVVAAPATSSNRKVLSQQAMNETLGFGEIVVVSLPDRTDRRDALEIISAYTNLKLKFVDGVDGSKMSKKEWPDETPKTFRDSMLGCWRAHANLWQYMLDSNLETLLILEDDIDWDVKIHEIFATLSEKLQHNPLRLDTPTERERMAAPYGLDWDVLMVGQCKDVSNPNRLDLSFSYHDSNGPYEKQIAELFRSQMRKLTDKEDLNRQRIITPTWEPVCTMGYAITRVGAMRLLTNLSYLGLHAAVDTEIGNHMKAGNLRGYTVTPPIFNAWRVSGWKDTDIQVHRQYYKSVGKGNKRGKSMNLKESARIKMLEALKQDNWARYNEKFPVERKSGATTK